MSELSLAVLGLAMLLPGVMSVDEVLVACDCRLLLVVLLLPLRDLCISLLPRCGVASAVCGNFGERDLPRAVGDVIEQVAIVRNDDECAGKLGECLLQPIQSSEVKVVCRLVEKEKIRRLHENTGESGAGLFTAREERYRLVEFVDSKPYSAQDGTDAGLDLVTSLTLERMQQIVVTMHHMLIITGRHLLL